MFYTNVFQRGKKIYVKGYDKGLRFKKVVDYKPYLFVSKADNKGDYKTIDNKPVDKIQFDSIPDARNFCELYEGVSNMKIYGLNNFKYLYIYDNFKGDISYDPAVINIVTLDIECAADEGFPSIKEADKEITAITLRSRGRSFVFGCGKFITDDPNIHYLQCQDEYELIQKFIKAWNVLDIDIITGYNTEFFDIPYLVNRITRLFNEKEAKKLSPYGIIDEKTVEFRGKENQSFVIAGISSLDYYQLYRKFTFGNQESYKLDYISQVELGEKKVDYSEYGSLLELYKNNYQKFIEYNIYDCILVDRLEEKLGFIQQVLTLAYDAKVNYNDTLTTILPWDIIIHNYLMDKKIVIPPMSGHRMEKDLVGGYVKDPKIGLSKWIVSLDAKSMYPSNIMQYNISADTQITKSYLLGLLNE